MQPPAKPGRSKPSKKAQRLVEASDGEHAEVVDKNGTVEMVFQSAPVAIITNDLNGKVTTWNSGAEKIFGWKSEEVIGRLNPVLPYDTLTDFKEEKVGIKFGKSVTDFELRQKNKSGSFVNVNVHISLIKDESGQANGFLLLVVDRTDRKLSGGDVIELVSQSQATFNAVKDAICLLDKNNKIVQCNDAMSEMFGLEAKKMLGKFVWRVVYGTSKPMRESPVFRMKTSLHRETSELQKGEQWFDISVDPILSGDNTLIGAIHIVRDITQQKKIEQVLIRVAGSMSSMGEDDFFTDLVSNMCLAMDADLGFVGELPMPDGNSIQTLAFYMDGKPATDFSYDLAGTPCQNVVGQKISIYPENVQELYPGDALLSTMEIAGYIGAPLIDSQLRSLGILVALYRRPILNPELMQTLIRIYASRASSELEHRRDAKELRKTEQKLRDIVEHSTNLYYSRTPENIFTYVSPQSRTFLGCEPVDAMVRWTEFMTSNPINQLGVEVSQRAVETGEAQPPYELELKTRDGKFIWVKVNEAPVIQDGKSIAIVGSLTDITDSKLAEETSLQSETSYRDLYNSVGEGIYIQGRDGRFLDVNKGAVQMYGYPREYLIGRKPENISAPGKNDIGRVYDLLARAFDGEPQQFEFWGVRRNGEVFPKEVRLSKGTYYGQDVVIALATDITERKRAETALQRQLQELSLLHAVAMFAVLAFDEDTLINQITDLFGKSIYPDDFGFLLLDEKTGALIPHPSYRAGTGLIEKVIPPGQGISGGVVQSGEPRRVSDVAKVAEYFKAFPSARSELCVPLKVGGRIIGVINTESKQEGAFSEDDERLLVTLAGQVTTAIEHFRVQAAEREQHMLTEALRDTAAAMSSTLDFNQVLDRILDNIDRVVPSKAASIMLVTNETARVIRHRGYRERGQAEWIEKLILKSVDIPSMQRILQEGRVQLISDTQKDTEWVTFPATDWIRSYLGSPIFQNDRVIGLINLDHDIPGFFTPAHAERLEAFASQAAVAIENARLYQNAVLSSERRAILHRLSQDIVRSIQNTEKTYAAIHTAAKRLMPCDAFVISLVDQQRKDYQLVYLIEGKKRYPPKRISEGQGLSGMVINKGKTLVINDVGGDVTSKLIHFGSPQSVQSVIATPLRIGDRTIGMLSAQCFKPRAYGGEDQVLLEMLASYAAAAVDNARLFEAEHKRWEEAETLREAGAAVASTLDRQQAVELILDQLIRVVPYDSASVQLLEHGSLEIVGGRGWPDLQAVMGTRFPVPGNNPNTLVIQNRKPLILRNAPSEYELFRESLHSQILSWLGVPLIVHDRVIGMLALDSAQSNYFTEESARLAGAFANHAAVAIENARLFVETQHRLTILETVNRISTGLRAALTVEDMLPRLIDEMLSALKTDSGVIWLYDPTSSMLEEAVTRGWFKEIREQPFPPGVGIAGLVFQTGETIVSAEFATDPRSREATREQIPLGWGGACVPIRTMQEIVGVLFVSVRLPRHLNQEDVNLLVTISEMAGNAIRRASLYEQSERQVQRLAALRSIDMVISSMLDMHVALQTLLELIIAQLKVDAADVLLYNKNSQMLEYEAGIGFRTNVVRQTRISLGQSLAGRAALERTRHIHISNLRDRTGPPLHQQMIHQEDFLEYHGIALVAKGQVVGVLEIYNRSPLANDPEWLDFLDTVASEVAIEIDNSRLFVSLQRSNAELSVAYDKTIEGWSHALDLRDRETEGHTQRVTKLTEELARKMRLPEQELIHARRGALLHDIGKMGIPDRILHKTGPLNSEEWITMRQHPVFAYEMLSSIAYLRPALDIPYCHHEWWDGSGYPRGLKGEQIPLAARIFAVVDVWDALSSDRPYRKAWKPEDIITQLRALKGKQFDPDMVDVFLKMIEAG